MRGCWLPGDSKSSESRSCAGWERPIELKLRMAFAPQRIRQRIVSLAPSVTSILVAIGARRELVGVSKWCKDVADVSGLPEIAGDCWHLSGAAEANESTATVMKLRPTLIVGSVPFQAETVQKILALPVPFLALNPRTLSDIESDIRLLGGISGINERASELIFKMRKEFRGISVIARKAKKRPRVYCEAWPHPRISSPPWVAELVGICGGKMVVRAGERISDEEVARANPEVIVLAWAATGAKSKPEQAFRNPAWKDVIAVRERRVFAIRDELLNTPGPSLARGAEELLRLIHPELIGNNQKHHQTKRSRAR